MNIIKILAAITYTTIMLPLTAFSRTIEKHSDNGFLKMPDAINQNDNMMSSSLLSSNVNVQNYADFDLNNTESFFERKRKTHKVKVKKKGLEELQKAKKDFDNADTELKKIKVYKKDIDNQHNKVVKMEQDTKLNLQTELAKEWQNTVLNEGFSKENEELLGIHQSSIETDVDKGVIALDLLKDKLKNFINTGSQAGLSNDNLEAANFLIDKNDVFIQKFQYKNNEVLRFGINPSKMNTETINSNKNNLDNTYTLENNIIKAALEATSQKTVLVDIFARESNGKIKVDSTNTQTNTNNNIIVNLDNNQYTHTSTKPETHTILLYKQGDKVLVIDPSNSTYSSKLVTGVNYKEKAFSGFNVDYCKTFGGGKETQIYSPVGEKTKIGEGLLKKYNSITGPNADQYRDCIDIAVKLSFMIESDQNISNLLQNLQSQSNKGAKCEFESIKYISNNDKLDKTIFYKDKEPIRIKQNYDINKIKNYNLTQSNTNKKLEILDGLNPNSKAKVEITNCYKNAKEITNFYECDKILTNNLHKEIDNFDINLSGELNQVHDL